MKLGGMTYHGFVQREKKQQEWIELRRGEGGETDDVVIYCSRHYQDTLLKVTCMHLSYTRPTSSLSVTARD
jgi:hypothetical protein